MALVVRPPKTGGNDTYVEEVADGFTIIKAAEVDADLQAIIDGGVNNIEAANIADNTITADQLAVGATVRDSVTAAATQINTSNTTTETTFLTLPSITTAGGRVLLGSNITGHFLKASDDGGTQNIPITYRLKRDATTISTWQHNSVGISLSLAGTTVLQLTFPLPFQFSFLDEPVAGSYVYTATVQAGVASSGSIIVATTGNIGSGFAMEFA